MLPSSSARMVFSVRSAWRSRQIDRAHHHARRAEAALQAVMVAKSLLHRMQAAVGGGNAFDGDDARALRLHREHVAALHRLAVHVDGAGAALGGVAADVRAGQAQMVADEVDEQRARLDFGGDRLAVDGQGKLNWTWVSSVVEYGVVVGLARALKPVAKSFR